VICHNVINLLDGFGKDFILVETVGVGQAELDVMQIVDTTVVVLAPECGDSIQAMKAGLLEIADIFVINKADSPGASRLVADLEMLVHRNPRQAWWETPILETQAVNNIGIDELISQIERRCRALQEDGRLSVRRKEQRRSEFLRITKKKIADRVIDSIEADPRLKKYLDQVETGELDPYTASEEILSSLDFPASRRDDHPTAGKSG
jgi:LAO/AO transport system kinase